MPTPEEFATNFDGRETPKELALLRDFEERASGAYFSDGFELTVNDKGALASWSTDADFVSALMPFAQANGSGSFYALWNDGSAPSEMPVVVFGDEGGVFVVAEDVKGLLRLLTYDAEPMVDDEVSFDAGADHRAASRAHDDYVAWLDRTFALAPVDDPDSLVRAAQEKHGEAFATWFASYVG